MRRRAAHADRQERGGSLCGEWCWRKVGRFAGIAALKRAKSPTTVRAAVMPAVQASGGALEIGQGKCPRGGHLIRLDRGGEGLQSWGDAQFQQQCLLAFQRQASNAVDQ